MTQEEYFQTIGQIVYGYLGLQYGISLLGDKIAHGFVGIGDIKILASVAHDFKLLLLTRQDEELQVISDDFTALSQTFTGFLETTPFGANTGLNELGSSELSQYWDPDKLITLLNSISQLQAKVSDKSGRMS